MAELNSQPLAPSPSGFEHGRTLLNTRQAAAYLDGLYAPATLESMRTRGGGPPFRKVNGRVFYLPGDLDTWVAEIRPVRSTAEYQPTAG
jgi:hypothetical protein